MIHYHHLLRKHIHNPFNRCFLSCRANLHSYFMINSQQTILKCRYAGREKKLTSIFRNQFDGQWNPFRDDKHLLRVENPIVSWWFLRSPFESSWIKDEAKSSRRYRSPFAPETSRNVVSKWTEIGGDWDWQLPLSPFSSRMRTSGESRVANLRENIFRLFVTPLKHRH